MWCWLRKSKLNFYPLNWNVAFLWLSPQDRCVGLAYYQSAPVIKSMWVKPARRGYHQSNCSFEHSCNHLSHHPNSPCGFGLKKQTLNLANQKLSLWSSAIPYARYAFLFSLTVIWIVCSIPLFLHYLPHASISACSILCLHFPHSFQWSCWNLELGIW